MSTNTKTDGIEAAVAAFCDRSLFRAWLQRQHQIGTLGLTCHTTQDPLAKYGQSLAMRDVNVYTIFTSFSWGDSLTRQFVDHKPWQIQWTYALDNRFVVRPIGVGVAMALEILESLP